METKTHEQRMNEELQRRRDDAAWDGSIARQVLRRRRRRIGLAVMGPVAGLAAAASLVAALTGVITFDSTEGARLAHLVNTQVDGTYGRVFGDESAGDAGAEDTIDSFIDATLSQRI